MSAEYRLTVVRKEITDFSMSTELKTKPMQGKPFLVLLFNSAILFLRQQERLFLTTVPALISDKLNVSMFNPFTCESDKHLISPYSIISESHIKVMRIKRMIMK